MPVLAYCCSIVPPYGESVYDCQEKCLTPQGDANLDQACRSRITALRLSVDFTGKNPGAGLFAADYVSKYGLFTQKL
jgi:hypothetical protein